MVKRKQWITVIACLLALVAIIGAASAIFPVSDLKDPDECQHEGYKLVKTEATADGSVFTYYCGDCDSRIERAMKADAFADNIPEINGSQINYLGNWTVGDYMNGTYTVYDEVHDDVDNYQSKWLILSSATNLWNGTGGFNPYCVAPSYNHRIGVASGGHDCAIVWTAPRDGLVVLGASDFQIKYDNNNYNLTVYHNGERVAPKNGYINISPSAVNDGEALTAALQDIRVTVKAGDKILFNASRITEGANESFMPTVTYIDGVLHLR